MHTSAAANCEEAKQRAHTHESARAHPHTLASTSDRLRSLGEPCVCVCVVVRVCVVLLLLLQTLIRLSLKRQSIAYNPLLTLPLAIAAHKVKERAQAFSSDLAAVDHWEGGRPLRKKAISTNCSLLSSFSLYLTSSPPRPCVLIHYICSFCYGHGVTF